MYVDEIYIYKYNTTSEKAWVYYRLEYQAMPFFACRIHVAHDGVLCTFSNRSQPRPVPEFIDPRFRENKPKSFVFSH
jgi:hypothetical protein